MKQMPSRDSTIAAAILAVSFCTAATGQIEVTANGSLRGVRIGGELMAFRAGIRVVPPRDPKTAPTGGGRTASGRYSHEGDDWTVIGDLAGRQPRPGNWESARRRGTAGYRAVYRQTASDSINTEILIDATAETAIGGVNFVVTLPGTDYTGSSAYLIEPAETQIALATTQPAKPDLYCRTVAKGVRVGCSRRQFEIIFSSPQQMIIQDDRKRGNGDIELSFPLSQGNLAVDQHVRSTFTIKATGEVDKSPATLVLDTSHLGRAFDGIGGNFRIQSPADAAHIQYNLDNLRVAWGRVAVPLDRWQPDEDADPIAAGDPDRVVREAMEMAETLAKRKIPIIASVWSAPRWALGKEDGKDGHRRVKPEKWDKVCKSIGGYLDYLKDRYGVEVELFSFNEPDLGIDVLQSPQEHADAIKRLGAYFASRGFKAKMILGDTGNPVAPGFIEPALADTEAIKYIGAVSFHSWGSGTAEQYARFGEAARRLNVPLIIGEGGTDAMAFRGRNVFIEPWYALEEISQYVEICRVAQPLSILHWQLTADFSVLTGDRDGRPLQPAQRFWQLKQLGMTNPGAVAVPITCDKNGVVACAFVDRECYVVHVTNKGASRKATLSGLPSDAGTLRIRVTDARRCMQESGGVTVADGKAELSLDSMSFTTIVAPSSRISAPSP